MCGVTMSAIDNMPTVACFQTLIIGKWIIMDNRLGGVDNICVLRRRTARNAVTRPTTGHSEGDRSADKRHTDRGPSVITKQVQPILHVYNIGGLGVLDSSILSQPQVRHSSCSGVPHHLMFDTYKKICKFQDKIQNL